MGDLAPSEGYRREIADKPAWVRGRGGPGAKLLFGGALGDGPVAD